MYTQDNKQPRKIKNNMKNVYLHRNVLRIIFNIREHLILWVSVCVFMFEFNCLYPFFFIATAFIHSTDDLLTCFGSTKQTCTLFLMKYIGHHDQIKSSTSVGK